MQIIFNKIIEYEREKEGGRVICYIPCFLSFSHKESLIVLQACPNFENCIYSVASCVMEHCSTLWNVASRSRRQYISCAIILWKYWHVCLQSTH